MQNLIHSRRWPQLCEAALKGALRDVDPVPVLFSAARAGMPVNMWQVLVEITQMTHYPLAGLFRWLLSLDADEYVAAALRKVPLGSLRGKITHSKL